MENETKEKVNSDNGMIWFSKRVDTVVILGAIITSMLWMNSQFNNIGNRFSEVEKDLAVIKTILVM